MAFDLGNFFNDIFRPARGEVVTVMIDYPHDQIIDTPAWQERRQMAQDWRDYLHQHAQKWGISVNPIVTYAATGSNNANLPADGQVDNQNKTLEDIIKASTIILAMPQFSATAPLSKYSQQPGKLRIGSMPGVAKFMEESGLSADYSKIAQRCQQLEPFFNQAIAAEVIFSSGHSCFFDLSSNNKAHLDDGILHPSRAGSPAALSNLPAGEVYIVPNENDNSNTHGELPEKTDNEIITYIVEHNRIIDVKGNSQKAQDLRSQFQKDPAWQNIAEFAIGVNDKARVTGIVLEDEKAGFHWAYGRSDHFGGKIGVEHFKTRVVHQDIVYAKLSPIYCKKLDMIFPDNSRKTLIINGDLQI